LVSVSVGGGPPVLVTLDTGSYGLRILPTALGPDAVHIPDTAHVVRYGGGGFHCEKVHAVVSLVGPTRASTPAPIVVDAIDPAANPGVVSRLARKAGSEGILGIAPNAPPARSDAVLSPLAQLAGPLAAGFTVTATRCGLTIVDTGTGTAVAPRLPCRPERHHQPRLRPVTRSPYRRTTAASWKRSPPRPAHPATG
jgi:hypothetical protein